VRRWWVRGLGRYLLTHPGSVAVVLRAAWRLRRAHWWRHPPFLPLAAKEYWDFRLTTVNGRNGDLDPAGVVAVAKWSERQRVGG